MKQQYSVKNTPRDNPLGVKLYYVTLNIEAGGHRTAIPRGVGVRRTIIVHTAEGGGVAGIRTSVPPIYSTVSVIIFISNFAIPVFIIVILLLFVLFITISVFSSTMNFKFCFKTDGFSCCSYIRRVATTATTCIIGIFCNSFQYVLKVSR